MKTESSKETTPVSTAGAKGLSDLAELFDGHIAREFADHDVNAT